MAQLLKVLAPKPDVKSISEIYKVEGDNKFPHVVLWPPHMLHCMCKPPASCPHIQRFVIFRKLNANEKTPIK